MKNVLILTAVAFIFFTSGCKKNLSGDLVGVTFTYISAKTYPFYKLGGSIVNYNEILAYDSAKHIFLLSDIAGKRIRKEKYPVSPLPFAIAVDGELIYIANFIPGYSSMSCSDCITIEPYSYDNKYRVELGYPGPGYFKGIDPRNDNKIISRFKKDNKLLAIN